MILKVFYYKNIFFLYKLLKNFELIEEHVQ